MLMVIEIGCRYRGVGVRDPLQQIDVAPQQRPHVFAANALLRAVLAVVVQLAQKRHVPVAE